MSPYLILTVSIGFIFLQYLFGWRLLLFFTVLYNIFDGGFFSCCLVCFVCLCKTFGLFDWVCFFFVSVRFVSVHLIVWIGVYSVLSVYICIVWMGLVLYSESFPTKDSLWAWNEPSDHAANTATTQTSSIYLGNHWKHSSNKPTLWPSTLYSKHSCFCNYKQITQETQNANWQTNQPCDHPLKTVKKIVFAISNYDNQKWYLLKRKYTQKHRKNSECCPGHYLIVNHQCHSILTQHHKISTSTNLYCCCLRITDFCTVYPGSCSI